MKQFLTFVKKYSALFIALLIIILVIVPYIVLWFVLRKNKKKIQIKPKFEIIDMTNDIDDNILNVLPDAVDLGKNIVKKFGVK